MTEGFPPNRNKQPKTLARTMGRIAIDLMEYRQKTFKIFNSNAFGGNKPYDPAPVVGCACCDRSVNVSPGDNGDFTSVQDAIDFVAGETPTVDEPWVIEICPGVYQEDITIGNSYIHLKGKGPRGSVIIEMTDGDTYTSTVGNVSIENIHFKCIGINTYVGPNIGTVKISNTTTDLTYFRNCIFETQLDELLGYNLYIYEATVTVEDSKYIYNQTGNEALATGIHSTVLFDSDADFRMVGCEVENIVEDENNPMVVFNDPNSSGIRHEIYNNKIWYESIAAAYVVGVDISLTNFTGDNLPGFLALTDGAHVFFNNTYYGVSSVAIGMFVNCYKMATTTALLKLKSQFNDINMEVHGATPAANMIYYDLAGGGLIVNEIFIAFDQIDSVYTRTVTAFDTAKYIFSSGWGELKVFHGATINEGQGTNVIDDFTAQGGTVADLLKTIASTDTVVLGNITDWTAGNVIYIPLNDDIETAITNATAGDTIILADGTYTITNPITIAKAINIIGQGKGQTVLASTTADITVIDITVDNVALANFSIDVNASGDCFGIESIPALTVDNVVVSNLDISVVGADQSCGIWVSRGNNWLIEDCDVYTASTNADLVWGIVFNAVVGGSDLYNRIVDCDVRANTTVAGESTAIWCGGVIGGGGMLIDLVNVHSEANSASGICRAVYADDADTTVNIYEGTYSTSTTSVHASTNEIYNGGGGTVINCFGPVACQNRNGYGTTNNGRFIAGGLDLDHPPRTRIYLSNPMINLVANAWTLILFDAMETDSDAQADLANNRIVIVNEGDFIITARNRWSGGMAAGNRMSAQILRNGATIDVDDQHASLTSYQTNPLHRQIHLNVGDLITAQARAQTAGNTADIQAGANTTYLHLEKLS